MICTGLFIGMSFIINGKYSPEADPYKIKTSFLKHLHLASPALVPAGRNIAFESGNAVSNAPGSYLTMLDCCESDEAISHRISVGETTCRIIKRGKHH